MKTPTNATLRRSAWLVLCFSYAAALQAGLVFQQEGGEIGSSKPKQKVTVSIESGKIRIDTQGGDQKQAVMIFDGDKQVMWMVSPAEGVYREITAAQVQQMGNAMGGMMQQMQAQMAQMPPEQRAMMEQMMRQRMGGAGMGGGAPSISIQEKGSGEKVGQYTTTHYQIMTNGQVSEDIWAAAPDQVKLSAADFKTFQDMAKFFEPLRRNLPKGSWSTPDMQQIKGLPVRTVIYEGGKPSAEWNATSIEQKSVDAGQFTLPANLKKADMMGGMDGGMGGPGMGPGGGMGGPGGMGGGMPQGR
jgi:hypothetical protein